MIIMNNISVPFTSQNFKQDGRLFWKLGTFVADFVSKQLSRNFEKQTLHLKISGIIKKCS